MTLRILSVDGGGYLGLATAAFVEGVERRFRTTFHNHFDLYCGSSTGAIIALGLATGKSGAEIVDIYRRWGPRIFGGDSRGAIRGRGRIRGWLRGHRGLLRPKYPVEPLVEALHEAFGDLTLADLAARGKHAIVTAFCTTTGHPRIFKTNPADRHTPHCRYRLCDVILASSAAPTYFQLVRLVNPATQQPEVFCDGGVVANHPALLGYAEAVAELRTPPQDIRLLSLGTPQRDLSEPPLSGRALQRGLWGWRNNLAPILIESNAQISHQILKRIVGSYGPAGPRYERVEMHNRARIPFDRVDESATGELVKMGTAAAASDEVARRMAPFFTDPAPATASAP